MENQTNSSQTAAHNATDQKLTEIKSQFLIKYKQKIDHGAYHSKDLVRLKANNEWLRAFYYYAFKDPHKTMEMLDESLTWRKNFGANDLLAPGSLPCNENLMKQGSFFVRNRDKKGHLILHIAVRTHKKDRYSHEQVCRCAAYWFEKHYKFAPGHPIVVCFDNYDAGYSNMDMEVTKFIINCIRTYYPCSTDYILVNDLPFAFNAVWKIVKAILPAKAVEIIKFVDKKKIKEFIDDSNLFVHMGGTDDFKINPNDPNFFECVRNGSF